MERDFTTYLLACLLAIVMGIWALQAHLVRPLVQMVERTATSIAEAGERR